jgi:hypothetical protein
MYWKLDTQNDGSCVNNILNILLKQYLAKIDSLIATVEVHIFSFYSEYS